MDPKRWLLLLLLGAPVHLPAAELVVRIHGIEENTGALRIAVYDQARAWLTSDVAAARVIDLHDLTAGADGTTYEVVLRAMPAGRLAIAVFHDRDGDGRLGRGLFGVPAEPVAFSGRHRWKIPPGFEEAAFSLQEQQPTTVAMRLR
jgi:uncharacterized protein (DUF2141 family)